MTPTWSGPSARLDELRTVALEDRATVRLAQGAHAPVAAELEALTGTYPMRERLWALRALALVHGGRQADALDVLRELADLLDDELGLEPSEELRDLQVRILRQDPALRWEAGNDSSPTAPPSATTPASGPASHRPSLPAWPMVGRVGELARLGHALEGAVAGTPTYATLTGEPGIGKSRLAAELGARAVDAGARLLVGRCSQDDGAPPLWPWQQVLHGLDRELEVESSADQGAGFRTWERSSGGCERPPATRRSWWSSRTSTGPTARACKCCDCWSRPSPRVGCWCWRPGARTPSPPARWPTSPRRCRGPTRSGSSSPASTVPPPGTSWPPLAAPNRALRTPKSWRGVRTATRSTSWSSRGSPRKATLPCS